MTSRSLKGEAAETAQGGKERKERESQDRRMVPLDRLEEMHPDPFDLVNADAPEHIGPGEVKIEIDRLVRQSPHGEIGTVQEALHHLSADGDGAGRMQGMAPSGQAHQMRLRG